jgi:putative sugar O-methyltransferase
VKKIKKKKIIKFFKKIFSISEKNVSTLSSKQFINWWSDYQQKNIDTDLKIMINDLVQNKNFEKYSPYWNYLAQSHIKLLNEKGISNFKQTIENNHYWGEVSAFPTMIDPIKNKEIKIKYDKKEINKKHDFCSLEESKKINKTNLILINYLVEEGFQKYLNIVNENNFGNSIIFKYQNRNYSYALLNSLLDIDLLKKNILQNEYSSILEIGAGSGRLCNALMQIDENLNHTICDIPPALFIAQKNLSTIFKNKKIFKYRNFENFNDVKNEFISSDIRFLLPEQLKLLPNKLFKLSVAIDCLHELNFTQVNNYFDEFNRLSNFFYFKCQNEQLADFGEKKKLNIDNYPIKENWSKLVHEKCYIPNGYFHALYKIK